VRNKVKVYGATLDNVQIIYTAQESASVVREEIIRDDNITTYTQAETVADAKLEVLKTAPVVGTITGFFLPKIQPGEKIYLSCQNSGIYPGQLYDILSFKHELNNKSGNYVTTVTVNKEPRSQSSLIGSIYFTQKSTQNTQNNPEGMDFSYAFPFTEDSGTHSSTEIISGVLKLSSGSSGNWISDSRTLSDTPTNCYLILNGINIPGASVYVSLDNGVNYDSVTPFTTTSLTTTGTALVIKVVFTDATTQIESLSILY
jgi:hypothetical protein